MTKSHSESGLFDAWFDRRSQSAKGHDKKKKSSIHGLIIRIYPLMQISAEQDQERRRKSSYRAGKSSGRNLFRIEGCIVTINEMISRTGKDESALRADIKKLHGKPITWEMLS